MFNMLRYKSFILNFQSIEFELGVILQKLDISLIMTDYCMPEMTGYDLLKRVKV